MRIAQLIHGLTCDTRPEDARTEDMLTFMVVGGLVGASSFTLLGLSAETLFTNTDRASAFSYGQQAGWFSLPTCAFLGIGTGLAIFFARMRQLAISSGILFVTAITAIRFTWWLWCDQRRSNGYDRSEIVLYYIPFILCIVTLLTGMVFLLGHVWLAIDTRLAEVHNKTMDQSPQ